MKGGGTYIDIANGDSAGHFCGIEIWGGEGRILSEILVGRLGVVRFLAFRARSWLCAEERCGLETFFG